MLLLSRRHLSGTLSSEVNTAKSPPSLLGDEKVLLGGKGGKDRKASACCQGSHFQDLSRISKAPPPKHSNSVATIISQTMASLS